MKSRSTPLVLIASVFLSCAPAKASDEKIDIVGLQLGMTVDEAQAAIRKYNPNLVIQPPARKVLQYRVANETRKTAPYVSSIFAGTGKKQADNISVFFSYPPGEPRVIAITRMHNNFDPPILRENYYKALVAKYGAPAASQNDTLADNSRRMYWYQWHVGDGKVQCARLFSGGREVKGQFGSLSVEQGEVLKRIMDSSTGKMLNPEASNPSDCAVLLTYQLNYDPLFSATGTLIDVAGAARSEQELSKWIDELIRKGEAEIQGSTAAPKL
jgi:hypothetical protein